jgi:ATP-binding cassette subfamily B protein
MDEGRIVEEGTHDQLMAHRGAYWRLYEAQARQEKAERDRMLVTEDPPAPPPALPTAPLIDREAEVDPAAGLKEEHK